MTNTIHHKTHINQVDYIRAFASLAVALFHLGGKTLPVLNMGWLGVQMFFLLSGFIICWSMPIDYSINNSGTFILRRIIRIETPYLTSIILILGLNYLLTTNYHADWVNVLCHFAYINSFIGKEYLSPVYWTLGIEFQFYLIIAFAFPLINSKYGKWVLILMLGSVLIMPKIGNTIVSTYPLFSMGIATYLFKSTKLSLQWFLIILISSIFVATFTMQILPIFAGLIALIILFLPLNKNNIISFLSKISFSLYLTHDIIGSRVVVYLGTLMPKTILFKGIDFASGIVVSLMFAYLFNTVVERPAMKIAKKFKYKLYSY